jgi:succinate-semialdehyde dehydrogenase/glutarate-semialdehyde dehydrogenase
MEGGGSMRLVSRNPYTGQVVEEFEALSLEDSVREINRSRQAFLSWKAVPAQDRAGYLRVLSKRLKDQSRTFAETITREMGKPIGQALSEVEKCAWLCDYFAENGARFLEDEVVETDSLKSYVALDPLGIILGSCRGTSHSGRFSGLRSRPLWPAMSAC